MTMSQNGHDTRFLAIANIQRVYQSGKYTFDTRYCRLTAPLEERGSGH